MHISAHTCMCVKDETLLIASQIQITEKQVKTEEKIKWVKDKTYLIASQMQITGTQVTTETYI